MTTPTAATPLTIPGELTAVELDRAGLLQTEPTVQISRFAIFVPGILWAPCAQSRSALVR
ncbi:MAG: hypothetical protein ACRDRX_14640 [Pseudonocardiaceae bacterium]